MPDPILYDTHMHTPLCKHADGEPEEYAQVAELRGLKGIVMTCHNPIPGGYSAGVRMDPEQWDEYLAIVARARKAWAGRVDVRLGLEADYYPGAEQWLEEQLQSAPLHYVLGSVHPQIPEYLQRYHTGQPLDLYRRYFTHLADAAETGYFDCLSHPDIVKNCYINSWDLDALLDHIRACLDRIAATNVSMEFNTSGWNKVSGEANPGPVMLREMAKRNIAVVIGSDSHTPDRVGDRFEDAMDELEAAGYTHIGYYLERTRREVSIADARATLKPVTIV